jgi:hypothetical protein
LTDIVWRDKLDINMLTNTHDPPLNGNFGDEHGKVTGYNDRQGNGMGGGLLIHFSRLDNSDAFPPPICFTKMT